MKKKILEMVSHKRQDTTATVIPCLYLLLFTVLRTLAAGLPVNKKRTQTLSHRESGSGTNCIVGRACPKPCWNEYGKLEVILLAFHKSYD